MVPLQRKIFLLTLRMRPKVVHSLSNEREKNVLFLFYSSVLKAVVSVAYAFFPAEFLFNWISTKFLFNGMERRPRSWCLVLKEWFSCTRSHERFTNWVICVMTLLTSIHMSSNLPFLYAQMASCCKGCQFVLRLFLPMAVFSAHIRGQLETQERPRALTNENWGIDTPAFLALRWTNSENHLLASQQS